MDLNHDRVALLRGDRVWTAIQREVLTMLQDESSTPDQIDAAFKEIFGAAQGPCRIMDDIGMDVISSIESRSVAGLHFDREHLDWLKKRFLDQARLGKKTPTVGGLFPRATLGTDIVLFFLNIGLAEPLDEKLSLADVMHRGSVMSLNVTQGDTIAREILTHEYMPDGIDVAGGRLFWSDMGNPKEPDGAIYSAKLDGSDIQKLVSDGQIFTPKQLIADEQLRKLYFCDREGGRVFRCDFDGDNLETLVQTADYRKGVLEETDCCVGVAVSKKLHKELFWTQKGASKATQGRIFSASLGAPNDPANRKDIELVAENLPEPIDLELDDEEGVLYWTDRGELPLGNTLNKKTISGPTPKEERRLGRQVLAQGFCEAIGLKVDRVNDCIWVADLGGHIWKCSRHRLGLKEKVYESATGAFTGITLGRV